MKITRRYSLGVVVPWYLGAVRLDHARLECIVAPIPMNLILRAGWIFWIWLRCPWSWSDAVRAEIAAKVNVAVAEAREQWEREITAQLCRDEIRNGFTESQYDAVVWYKLAPHVLAGPEAEFDALAEQLGTNARHRIISSLKDKRLKTLLAAREKAMKKPEAAA